MYPIRTFDYLNLADVLRQKKGAIGLPQLSRTADAGVIVLQYLITFAAFANLIDISIDLSTRTVCSFKPQTQYFPLGWIFLGIPVHLIGASALFFRMSFRRTQGREPGNSVTR
ncbi:hypothetical protein F4824DRAFT_133813 [Ustulina deusta]|nr:hypothetical protein F4824DRAFT_133813 [Ustulina deusta]